MLSNLYTPMNRNDLKKANVVPVPGVPGVFVREISGKEYRNFQGACSSSKVDLSLSDDDRNLRAVYQLVNLTACDADGRRFWTDTEMGDTEELPVVRAKAIFETALAHNGLSPDAEKKVN
ncbi:hypothetical protein [Limnoglobus roseus]|uniref:Uncharacterized protein n=1 Tax=Limnoglobus roseus TaxID=2598579 RepID=A0A5C1AI62_9BACT|nr:hypothetical protein [Limnoglobus roseus]QEL18530.1 hypothetical protein PX52LOC_05557 [Limnoglobus roseus]